MPKQRMTMLDLRCEVAELRTKLEGMRVANVYDINPRTYLLKFQKPGQKFLLLVESGTRAYSRCRRGSSAVTSLAWVLSCVAALWSLTMTLATV